MFRTLFVTIILLPPMVLPGSVIAGGYRLWQKAIPRLLIHSLIAGLDGTKNGPVPFFTIILTTNGPTRTSYRRGGPFMAAIIGPGGPFTAAKNGPGPFLAAVNGPPGPV